MYEPTFTDRYLNGSYFIYIDCLFYSLLGLTTKGTPKIRLTGPLRVESPNTQFFVAQ